MVSPLVRTTYTRLHKLHYDDLEVSSSLSRSKTMPSLGRPKLTRKLTTVTAHSDEDRLRQAKEKVEEAIKNRKVFMIKGGCSGIRNSLRRRGWVEKCYKAPRLNKSRKKNRSMTTSDDGQQKIPPRKEDDGIYGIMMAVDEEDMTSYDDVWEVTWGMKSRMVRNVNPSFIWVVKTDMSDFQALTKDQMINHYCKAASFTTKVNLCLNMKNVPWFENADPDTFFPRSYRLTDTDDQAAFTDDYRLTACMNILKIVVSHNTDGVREDEESSGEVTQAPESDKEEAGKKKDSIELSSTLTSSTSSPGKKKRRKKVIVPLRILEQALQRCEQFLASGEHDDIDRIQDPISLSDNQWDQLIRYYYNLVHDDGIIKSVPQNLLEQCESLLNQLQSKWPQFEMDGTRNVWILKPGAKSRGRGIVCYDKLEEILKFVDSTAARNDCFVIQKYIERPLLIYNTKFDIRQWFVVTDWNPLTLWFYQDSYLRFCSQQYTLDNFDEAIHLANNSIQKHKKNGPRSNKLPSDNMWSHEDFQEYLRNEKQPTIWEDVIYPGMKKAVICALLVTQDLIEDRKASFELYGADFMLTEDCQPLLIEINSSPTMDTSTSITAKLCPSVLEDTIKVVVDRKHDRNCDVGRFELAYKQPLVTVPSYHGINLSVDGTSIRKPGLFCKSEGGGQHHTPLSSIKQTMSSEKVSETKKSTTLNSIGEAPEGGKWAGYTPAKSSNQSASTGKNSSTQQSNTGKSSTSSKSEPVPQDPKVTAKIPENNKNEHSEGNHHHPIRHVNPQPPLHPKVCMQSPYLSGLTNRRIVSRTSVPSNYTNPLPKLERQKQGNSVSKQCGIL